MTSRVYTVTVRKNDPNQPENDQKNDETTVTTATYQLCSLNHPNEVDLWATFCAAVFSYKPRPPPASYFCNHYTNDPWARYTGVRVARNDSGEVVASVRVFYRIIHIAGQEVAARGIGEVCTHSHHRKRGLSKQLLHDAVQLMHTDGGQLSMLHAAPAFRGLYQSFGYQCVSTRWTRVSLLNGLEEPTAAARRHSFSIRPANFPHDTPALMRIHRTFSERRWDGCIVRNANYWNDYISVELQEWVCSMDTTDTDDDAILGFLALKARGDEWLLCDFGVTVGVEEPRMVFEALLRHAVAAARVLQHSSSTFDERPSTTLKVPTVVWEELTATNRASSWMSEASASVQDDDDEGWMYKKLDEHSVSMPNPQTHLIWPIDSF